MTQSDAAPAAATFRLVFGVLDAVLGKIETFVLLLAALIALLVMVTVSADALGRYLFNQPLIITIDLVSRYLLPIIMLATAGAVLRQARHISVDLFAAMMPQRVYHALLGFGLGVAAPIFWIMTYRVAHNAWESFVAGKVAFGLVPWPLWPEQVIYGVAMGLLTLRLAQLALANLVAAALDAPDIAVPLVNAHEHPVEEAV